MSLDDYQEPKGAYFDPAIEADLPDGASAETAIDALRAAGLTQRDIQVRREKNRVIVVVSSPVPGLLEEARRVLRASDAVDVRPYGAGAL